MPFEIQQTFSCDMCQVCFNDVYQYEQHKLKHSEYGGPLSYPMAAEEGKVPHPAQVPVPGTPLTQGAPSSGGASRTEQMGLSDQHSVNFVQDVKNNAL